MTWCTSLHLFIILHSGSLLALELWEAVPQNHEGKLFCNFDCFPLENTEIEVCITDYRHVTDDRQTIVLFFLYNTRIRARMHTYAHAHRHIVRALWLTCTCMPGTAELRETSWRVQCVHKYWRGIMEIHQDQTWLYNLQDRACGLTGLQTCERSGGWLVEVASQWALLLLISSSFALIFPLRACELQDPIPKTSGFQTLPFFC